MKQDDIKKIQDLIPADLQLKIKTMLQKFTATPAPAPAPAPIQLAEGTLADGTKVKSDTEKIEVGSTITVITPDGEMPAPVGEHVLQDGTIIKVGQGGKVTEIVTAPAPDANDMPMAQMRADFEAKINKFNAEKDALNAEVTDQKKEITELKTGMSDLAQMFSAFLETPMSNPKETPKGKPEKPNPLEKFINRDKK